MLKTKQILLIYATHSGSNFVVAQMIQEALSKDFEVTLQNAAETKPEDIKNYETIILGSPSWLSRGSEGMPSEIMLKLLDVWQTEKHTDKNFIVYGCGDSGFIHFCGAVDYMENFVKSVGGNSLHPSLRLDSFWFELDKNVALAKKWAADLNKKLTS
ncbi:MAG: hypothetical protein A2534_04635 [Candidatus Magasanikbacteria bacterium RIFOXYD2_FULL_39_9]|uniref:Flavodoxin-like domain-containing protein n=1 Tax=Candidatus Magasanikbacteria bacterium RIFOXYD1_FULL_40_23 TaxID=1798705 RepID=A0A1F6PAV3_9BACT|nr:MAG: hypothetical protein A2534_04635 [Candidatus Magasanikbacteria bacterium RIFOXYD2_FULL_39_9]OGH93315.1 MAG: hypothetical protein A2563_01770 [Candidatus Magasanikbacteria bacterium RIFOXYD1_FULL_40_23]